MKTLIKLALAAVILTSAFAAQAEWVRGHFRGNGTYVNPYYRTPANGIACDNLSYRSYVPRYPSYSSYACTYYPSYGYVSSPSYGCRWYSSTPSTFSGTSTSFGGTTYHSYRDSLGGSWSGTTMRLGNTSYTTIRGW